jgi:hypothetical protein
MYSNDNLLVLCHFATQLSSGLINATILWRNKIVKITYISGIEGNTYPSKLELVQS